MHIEGAFTATQAYVILIMQGLHGSSGVGVCSCVGVNSGCGLQMVAGMVSVTTSDSVLIYTIINFLVTLDMIYIYIFFFVICITIVVLQYSYIVSL